MLSQHNIFLYICFGVKVHYEGTLVAMGEIFDSTHEDNTIFSFEIGKGMVIKAWDVAVKTMRVRLLIASFCAPILTNLMSLCGFFRLGK